MQRRWCLGSGRVGFEGNHLRCGHPPSSVGRRSVCYRNSGWHSCAKGQFMYCPVGSIVDDYVGAAAVGRVSSPALDARHRHSRRSSNISYSVCKVNNHLKVTHLQQSQIARLLLVLERTTALVGSAGFIPPLEQIQFDLPKHPKKRVQPSRSIQVWARQPKGSPET